MGVTLNPNDPVASGFQQDGTQTVSPGNVLTLRDESVAAFVTLFANDPDAAAGLETDVVATFKLTSSTPNNADASNRIVINDGVGRAAIAACIVKNNQRCIGLYSSGPVSDPNSYPVAVPVDWGAAAVTVRLRRLANGDAEIVEVDGVVPNPRAILPAASCPGQCRPGATVELGCAGVESQAVVEYSAFRSERVQNPVGGTINFTAFAINDGTVDRIRFRGDYTLGAASNGINASAEQVTIQLSTPTAGVFYPPASTNPLNGFEVAGNPTRRRFRLNDAERTRCGIEQFVIDEDTATTGGTSFRDRNAVLAGGNDYSTVDVEITIGTGASADKLKGRVNLTKRPNGSWRL